MGCKGGGGIGLDIGHSITPMSEWTHDLRKNTWKDRKREKKTLRAVKEQPLRGCLDVWKNLYLKVFSYYTVHVWEKDESLLASISRKTFSFIIIQLDFILEGMSYLVENARDIFLPLAFKVVWHLTLSDFWYYLTDFWYCFLYYLT